ncbi:MAG: UDP-galactopyranose mutase [Bacteroidales bacterium]|jgi:UDP-galactopyranose mutase|nr:UDP-galactopyranose mutase [Bacteroidales bacterium]
MNIEHYGYIIVGSGFSGSVMARKIADAIEQGDLISRHKKILVLERRSVVSGNMYDEYDSSGILIQRYGPHIFHTDDEEIWQFISPFAPSWNRFNTGCSRVDINVGSNFDRKFPLFDSPFNFTAIDAFYDTLVAERIKDKLLYHFSGRNIVHLDDLIHNADPDIRSLGNDIYKYDVIPYTVKQWGVQPEEIDKSVLKRVPMRLSYEWDQTGDKYQVLPQGSFYGLFTKLLNHPLIDVCLNTDAMNFLSIDTEGKKIYWCGEILPEDKILFFTGKIDELLGYKYGMCGYRSLSFDYKVFNVNSFQDFPIMIHPFANGYTRITEYKKLPVQNIRNVTIVAYEYPKPVEDKTTEPFYPLLTRDPKERYTKYRDKVQGIENLYLFGRLGDYKYYNMDQAIRRALDIFEQVRAHPIN